MDHKWIHWARKMHAIAQSGIAFSRDVYDLERYEELRSLSAEIMEQYSEVKKETIEEWFAKEAGYQTPKLDVRGALFKENKILLVREKNRASLVSPRWFLRRGAICKRKYC